MPEILTTASGAVALLAAVGSGLIAGLLFIFSNSTMRAFDSLGHAAAIRSMQAVNREILNPVFFTVFLGTAVTSLAGVVIGVSGWAAGGADRIALAVAGGLYLIGIFVVTAARNVPMNERLDTIDPDAEEAAAAWADYLNRWTRWNHVRTVAGTLASAGFIIAIAA